MRKKSWRRASSVVSIMLLVVLVGYAAIRWNDFSARFANAQGLFSTPQYFGGLDSADAMLQFASERPNDVALASYTVGLDGKPTGEVLSHQADEPMPLASTMKIVVLAAYAHAVAQGQVAPQQPIKVADWERFYLPGTDNGAHVAALEEFQVAADSQGFAQDGNALVPLDRVVWAMIRYSDNAAADYVYERLGADAIEAISTLAGLEGQEPILPLDGTFLAWDNHEHGYSVDGLLALDSVAYAQEVARLHNAYGEAEWRAAERMWRTNERGATRIVHEAQLAERFMPKGTVRDYARIMAGVISGTFLSPEVSATMRTYLEWPMEKPGNQQRFTAFGAKGGSVAGVLTEAMFVVPKQGPFASKPRVVVLFLRNLPPGAWLRLTKTFAQQDLALAIATDSTISTQVAQTFPKYSIPK